MAASSAIGAESASGRRRALAPRSLLAGLDRARDGAGLSLGRFAPSAVALLDAGRIGSTSLPIAIGLLLMMYPVLAKVRYSEMGTLGRQSRLLVPSLVLNWIVGPALMFALAWLSCRIFRITERGSLLWALRAVSRWC